MAELSPSETLIGVLAALFIIAFLWLWFRPRRTKKAPLIGRNLRARLAYELAEYAELYALFVLGIAALAAHAFGKFSTEQTITTLLVTLVIFAFAMLRFLHRLQERERARPDDILLSAYPKRYLDDLAGAKDLWITGTNLRRIFPEHIRCLEEVLNNGGRITAVLAKPGSDASKYGVLQEYGYTNDELEAAFSKQIELSLSVLERLKNAAPSQVTILKITFPIYFGIDGINVNSWNGLIYVRYYPIAEGDRPIVVLRPYESRWFDFYRAQLLALTGEIYSARIDHLYEISALSRKLAFHQSEDTQLHRGFLKPYSDDEYRKFILAAEYFYVLSVQNKVVGFVLAHAKSKIGLLGEEEIYDHIAETRRGRFVVVRQICIDPDYSERGFGQRLYDHLFDQLRSTRAHDKTAVAFIWQRPLNSASAKFHKATGWSSVDTYELKDGSGAVSIWERAIS
jgi:GNAT superfamily N-acetyltransferase